MRMLRRIIVGRERLNMLNERLLGLARSALRHRLLGPVAALGALVVALAIAVPLALATISDAFVLRSLDGARFVAEVRGSGDDWVLLGHQFPTHRHTWDRLADRLLEEGYRVMVWDFRCHGESPCVYSNAKNDDVPDVWQEWEAAIDYAVEQGAQRIAGFGASFGGTSLMQVAAYREEFRAVGAISSPNVFRNQVEEGYRGYDGTTWDRLDGLKTVGEITVPKLFIVGATNRCAYLYSERYFERSVAPARLVVLETDLHGTNIIDDGELGPKAMAEIVAFLADPASVEGKEVRNEAPEADAFLECYGDDDDDD